MPDREAHSKISLEQKNHRLMRLGDEASQLATASLASAGRHWRRVVTSTASPQKTRTLSDKEIRAEEF